MKKIVRLTESQLYDLIKQAINELNEERTIPRAYEDNQHEAAYENALNCLYYGCGLKDWNSCGLSPEEAKEVWQRAKNKLGNLSEEKTNNTHMKNYDKQRPIEEKWDASSLADVLNYEDDEDDCIYKKKSKGKRERNYGNYKQGKPRWQ